MQLDTVGSFGKKCFWGCWWWVWINTMSPQSPPSRCAASTVMEGILALFCTGEIPPAVLNPVWGSQCKSCESSRGHQNDRGWRTGCVRRDWGRWVCSAWRREGEVETSLLSAAAQGEGAVSTLPMVGSWEPTHWKKESPHWIERKKKSPWQWSCTRPGVQRCCETIKTQLSWARFGTGCSSWLWFEQELGLGTKHTWWCDSCPTISASKVELCVKGQWLKLLNNLVEALTVPRKLSSLSYEIVRLQGRPWMNPFLCVEGIFMTVPRRIRVYETLPIAHV